FNVAPACPYTAHGSGGDPTSCDYFFDSANGCHAHNMDAYFGGQPPFPQNVVIKDNGTGIIGGFLRNTVTSTSIISDSIWGSPLPEIWANDDGDPQKAFWAQAIIASTRDESTYQDILGILSSGPISYEGMSVQINPITQFTFLVCPLADGFPPQGFKINANFTEDYANTHPELGLRQVAGNDPVNTTTDYFSLGQGTPQHWDVDSVLFGKIYPFAAGTSFVEMRYLKSPSTGIQPTT